MGLNPQPFPRLVSMSAFLISMDTTAVMTTDTHFSRSASLNSIVAKKYISTVPWKWFKLILNNAKFIDLHQIFPSTQSCTDYDMHQKVGTI